MSFTVPLSGPTFSSIIGWGLASAILVLVYLFFSASGEIMEQQASGGVPVLVEKIDTAEVESQSGAPPVYSAMTPATIQNEKGEIQHVYVTYDQQGTIQAINEHPGNSLGGSVVTITYPTPDSLPQQHQVGMPGVPVTGDLQLHTETSQPMVQEPVQVSTVPRPHV